MASAANPLTKEQVVASCLRNGGYKTAHCNEKLYLHHKGYDTIAGLEEYAECRVLWLEGNCISKIEGLEAMKDTLRSLYLQENMLTTLDGISIFTALDGLNVSDNCIASLDGFTAGFGLGGGASPLDTLQTLQAKNNKLKDTAALAALLKFKRLSVLDLSGNSLSDMEGVLSVLEQIPNLKSLRLNGNPMVRTTANYRKVVLGRCKHLLHLDDRPVFADERRLVTAWVQGGSEGEAAERKALKMEEEQAIERRLEEFRRMCEAARGDVSETDSSGSDGGETRMASTSSRSTASPLEAVEDQDVTAHSATDISASDLQIRAAPGEVNDDAHLGEGQEHDAQEECCWVP